MNPASTCGAAKCHFLPSQRLPTGLSLETSTSQSTFTRFPKFFIWNEFFIQNPPEDWLVSA
jgi:hypothetical protein